MPTGIAWTEETWNPLAGCSRVSDGEIDWTGKINLLPERLDQPLRWKRPRKIFVCSMTDLFGEFVPFAFIGDVYQTMGLAQQNIFQILTKRPGRRLDFYEWAEFNLGPDFLPLPNVWEGTSVEDQATADERIPHLLRCPAAVRWLSCEPLLGPIILPFPSGIYAGPYPDGFDDYSERRRDEWFKSQARAIVITRGEIGLHWVVVGGESGPKARPMHPDWARSLRGQCEAAGVAFFYKQWGAWAPTWALETGYKNEHQFDDGTFMFKVGKKAAGRVLDGRTWDEYPTPHHESTPTS